MENFEYRSILVDSGTIVHWKSVRTEGFLEEESHLWPTQKSGFIQLSLNHCIINYWGEYDKIWRCSTNTNTKIQLCKFKQGHSREVEEPPQGENFPSPASDPTNQSATINLYLYVDLTAGLSICRPTSILNTDQLLIYLCCKLIYNDIAPLDKQIMSFINSLSSGVQ